MIRPSKRSRLTVSLFPFLSLLICVMGTMSFIQILFSLSAVSANVRTAADGFSREIPLHIVCGPTSATIIHPQTSQLASVDSSVAQHLLARGSNESVSIQSLQATLHPKLLAALATNRFAAARLIDLEVFVLLSVRPGSAPCVHRTLMLLDAGHFRGLRRGLRFASEQEVGS